MRRGDKPPDLTLPDLGGNEVSLSDFKGKVVAVTFWAVYCPSCKAEIPHLRSYHKKYENEDAVLLAVSLDSGPDQYLKDFAKQWGISYPILRGDKRLCKQWRVRAIPVTYLIDQEGLIDTVYIGPEATGLLDRDTSRLLGR
ncbi:MAG: TlpA family protein disulfide reductase [Deltaproteobacteria bacterium]|nr:TlpA family protein disulfide reductase [Deltaproteobacteria bacterium]